MRTNPLSSRVGKLLNWPSNIQHPFLTNYINHIFQESLVSPIGIRSSTTSTWVNVTILPPISDAKDSKDYVHPKLSNPVLNFENMDLTHALGRLETRISNITTGHNDFKNIFEGLDKTLIHTSIKKYGNMGTLRLFKGPVNLRINVITNPLLDADICAQYVAKSLKQGKPLASIYRELLSKIA